MEYKTVKGYRQRIIMMIAEGKTNEKIWQAVGCNRKYPGIVRHELNAMTEEERTAVIEEAMGVPKEDENKKKNETPLFRTPTQYARGRYIRSGY